MKVFISHSNKDSEIAINFSRFLNSINIDIITFCSSLTGMIDQGENFVEVIGRELSNSNVFIPLISTNYLKSKYCMIELGYAYSQCIRKSEQYSIFPFCLPPITKGQALLGTPLAHIQTASLNDKNELHNFVNVLLNKQLINESYISNHVIYDFVDKVNNIIMNNDNILGHAVLMTICSDINNPDAIQYTGNNGRNIINYNLFANKKTVRPDFISFVLKFPDTFNFYDFLCTNSNINLNFTLNNYTNSLTNIDVEFKYHETHQILKKFKIDLKPDTNIFSIPIKDMNVEGLKMISEICFVVWDKYMTEEEGMFSIENIQVK